MKKKIALVLTGGGARAAYQVGILRAISDIMQFKENPFRIISGFSAGAINGAWLAGHSENFETVTKCMWEAWSSLHSEKIFKTNPVSLFFTGGRWIKDLSSGGWLGASKITYLLNTSPLRSFLESNIDFKAIRENIHSGRLSGISVCATNYQTGVSTAFFDGHTEIKDWERTNRISRKNEITLDHVMASAAIPIFFPPIKLNDAYYGDGMIRMNAPLSPAIHMGAEKLFVIGIRSKNEQVPAQSADGPSISLGDIAGTLLNGLFFDSIDADIERMQRINRTLSLMTPEQLQKDPDSLRPVPMLYLKPSKEVMDAPNYQMSSLPRTLRFLLKGIGVTEETGKDMLSYLTFEKDYLTSLLELGYSDGHANESRIRAFFEDRAL